MFEGRGFRGTIEYVAEFETVDAEADRGAESQTKLTKEGGASENFVPLTVQN